MYQLVRSLRSAKADLVVVSAKGSFVRKSDLGTSKFAALCMNGRFYFCSAAGYLGWHRCCTRERFTRITSGMGSTRSSE